MEKVVATCSVCGKIRVTKKQGNNKVDLWVDIGMTDKEKKEAGLTLSHGSCPDDLKKQLEEIKRMVWK